MDAEVLVIGGGPAGLAAAIAAAQAGFSVEVAEPCPGAIDKCCGEGLLPPAVDALRQLGIPVATLAEQGRRLSGIGFHHSGQSAWADFPACGQVAVGLRRTELHALLAGRARELGVRVTPAAGRVRVEGGAVRAFVGGQERRPRWTRWIIGADGAQSAVRRAAGLDEGGVASRRFALRQHFKLAPGAETPDGVEVYWAAGAQAYVTPVGGAQVGVAVLASAKPEERGVSAMRAAVARFPALARRLRGAEPCSSPRGAMTAHRTLRQVQRGRVALVGDASGGVDAITGDGLSLAFLQALALGRALQAGDLRLYQQDHDRLLRPARVMSRALLAMGAHPALTQASMLLLARVPGLFRSLLRLHIQPPFSAPPIPGVQENPPWQAALISIKSRM